MREAGPMVEVVSYLVFDIPNTKFQIDRRSWFDGRSGIVSGI